MRKIYYETIPSKDPRLGRHVMHDSESRKFEFPTEQLPIISKVWSRSIPILDQGNVGSCTGNAGIGDLGSDPMFSTFPFGSKYTLDEAGALKLYSDAEDIDGDGPYPPNDNGSFGLSIAKALKNAGMISGYQHTFSLDAALRALSVTPWITGINWYDGMFNPHPETGQVVPTGQIAGGHEIVCREINVENSQLWFDNSWGLSWGLSGRFWMTFEHFGELLEQQGDVTILLPLSAPAPQPVDPAADLAAAFNRNGWIDRRHIGDTGKIAKAAKTWLKSL